MHGTRKHLTLPKCPRALFNSRQSNPKPRLLMATSMFNRRGLSRSSTNFKRSNWLSLLCNHPQVLDPIDRQRDWVGWSASILFHLGLLIFGAGVLIRPVHSQVEAGKTSTEIILAIEPVFAPVTPLSVPAPPAFVPLLEKPVPIPEPVKHQVASTPKPAIARLSPSTTHPVPRQGASSKRISSSSKGAIQAQPDDLHNEPPEYSEDSRAAREEGVVILRVEVTATGAPASVTILKTCGYFRLDQAARRAVQHWKFHSAIAAGIAVSSEADVPVRFKLE